jgi:hypothetical protein
MSLPSVAVSFRLVGFSTSPNEVTKALGVSPTTTWVAGDAIQPGTRRRSENGWMLQSGDDHALDLEASILSLLNRLPSSSSGIFKAVGPCHVEITCGISARDQTPAINLKPATLQRIADLGATLDVDIVLID